MILFVAFAWITWQVGY